MKKIGRNDPCPCGSGKKFKNCCLGKQDQECEKNPAQQMMEEIREQLNNREFGSLEETNEFLGRFMERKDAVPQIDFLGLSSQQIHRMLYNPLETLEDMVGFNQALEPEAFLEIPVVKNSLFFLTRLKQVEPLKTTAKGNLPLAFAQELYSKFLDPSDRFHRNIRSEEDALAVNTLRHVLKMCGWLKKMKNHYSLTVKGTKLIEQGFSGSHFFSLLNVFVRRFNWAFQDRYPQFWIIQGGVVFSLYLLHRKGRQFIAASELGDSFIRSFPAVIGEAEESAPLLRVEDIRRCFSLRFLERFCEYFGLADIRREKTGSYKLELFVKKSAFYDQYIKWSDIS